MVRGLLSSVKSIGSIFVFDLLIITVFAVVGTHFFKVSYILYMCDPYSCESRGDPILIVHVLLLVNCVFLSSGSFSLLY